MGTKKTKKTKEEVSVVNLVEELSGKLLTLLGTKAKAKVTEDKENKGILIDIEAGEETGLIIGNRGKNLQAIQTLLGMMVRRETGEWVRILVNTSDWREKEEDRLKKLAIQAAERAKATGEPQYLYNLAPSQRRIIHIVLSEDSEIKTESQGEGSDRYLVINLK